MSGLHVDRDGDLVRVKRGPIVLRVPVHEWDLMVLRGNRVAAAIRGLTPAVPPGRINEKQRRHLHALMREREVEGDARHPFLSRILDRPVGSVNDLTYDEAEDCIGILSRTRPGRTIQAWERER